MKTIIDKTASFVARNGPEFESRILKNEQNNTKFSFLHANDPYQPYYKSRVAELGGVVAAPVAAGGETAVVSQETTAKTQKKGPSVVPLEPARPNYTVAKPPGAQPLDIDVIQLTAQCARPPPTPSCTPARPALALNSPASCTFRFLTAPCARHASHCHSWHTPFATGSLHAVRLCESAGSSRGMAAPS